MELPQIKTILCVASCRPGKSTLLTKGALELCTGQRGKTTLAKRSIASFNLRENSIVSCMVTLRGQQLYTFLDLFATLMMPKLFTTAQVAKKPNNCVSLGVSNFLEFPQFMPFFSDFESVKGLNINMIIKAKQRSARSVYSKQIWGL